MRLERLEQKSRLPVLKKNPQNYAMLMKLGEFNATFILRGFQSPYKTVTLSGNNVNLTSMDAKQGVNFSN